MRTRAALLVALCVAAASCASDDGDIPDSRIHHDDDLASAGCSITLAGEITGTFPCTSVAIRNHGGGDTVLAAKGLDLGPDLARIIVAVKIQGDPSAGAYEPSAFLGAGAQVLTAGNHLFAASNEPGTFGALAVASVDFREVAEIGMAWTVRANLSATLVDVSTGRTLTLTATF